MLFWIKTSFSKYYRELLHGMILSVINGTGVVLAAAHVEQAVDGPADAHALRIFGLDGF